MSATKIIRPNENGKNGGSSRIKLLTAIATGAITIEAANLLLRQEHPDENPITDDEVQAVAIELAHSANANGSGASLDTQTSEPDIEYIDEPGIFDEPETIDLTETEVEPIIEPEPIDMTDIDLMAEAEPIEADDTEADMLAEAEPIEADDTEADMLAEAEPIEADDTEADMLAEAEPIEADDTEADMLAEAEPIEIANQDNDLADLIIQEIDPDDIDMADAFVVDNVGSVINVNGNEYQAATILDPNGNQAFMVDMDGDNVYDVITTPSGDIIAEVSSDIDVSDAELLYAQQHDQDGYIAQNDFDISLNEDNPDIQDDIMLS